jgi:UDP-hydrolysing UDP-N-acetyl-D-glucosamine 2-epimerase
LDNIDKLDLPDRADLEREFGLPVNQAYFLVTYHPATLSTGNTSTEAEEMLAALDQFPDHRVLLTGVNADAGYDRISGLLSDYAAMNENRVSLHASLGQRRYLCAMKYAAAVVGNSSSGIIEAPAMKTPTVNIGDRQKGRLLAPSVIDCAGQTKDIAAAIGKALGSDFRDELKSMMPVYGTGGASEKIKDCLKSTDLTGINRKSFYDIVLQGAAS